MYDQSYSDLANNSIGNISWNYSSSFITSVGTIMKQYKNIGLNSESMPDMIVADNMIINPDANYPGIKIACALTSEIPNIISWYGETK
jgi:hypothetical protein